MPLSRGDGTTRVALSLPLWAVAYVSCHVSCFLFDLSCFPLTERHPLFPAAISPSCSRAHVTLMISSVFCVCVLCFPLLCVSVLSLASWPAGSCVWGVWCHVSGRPLLGPPAELLAAAAAATTGRHSGLIRVVGWLLMRRVVPACCSPLKLGRPLP